MTIKATAYEEWLGSHLDDSVRFFRSRREAQEEMHVFLRHGYDREHDGKCYECGQDLPCQFQRLSWAFDTEIEATRISVRTETAEALEEIVARLRDPDQPIQHECDGDW